MKRVFPAFFLVLGSLLISLAAGEVLLRVVGFSAPSFWLPDELTGVRLRPGAEGWRRAENDAYIKVNSQGLRDYEHAIPKPSDVYRIAVLGDSFAEAIQVSVEETFWWLLPKRLERCGFQSRKRIEAVNFGVSGHGTAQQLLTLRHRAWEYAPDLVLLAFFPGNDVRNNSKELERDRTRPFFVLKDDEIVLDNSFTADPGFRESSRLSVQRAAVQDLRLYQLLRKVRAGKFEVHHNAPIAIALANGAAKVPSLTEPGLDENVMREPSDKTWRDAWTVTDKLLLAIQEETRSRGVRFLVAVVSTAVAVHPDQGLRKRYAAHLGVRDLLYPEKRVRELGQRHAIEVVALTEDMQRYADAMGVHLHGFPKGRVGFGHWNPAGHALAADLIAAQLCGTGGSWIQGSVHP